MLLYGVEYFNRNELSTAPGETARQELARARPALGHKRTRGIFPRRRMVNRERFLFCVCVHYESSALLRKTDPPGSAVYYSVPRSGIVRDSVAAARPDLAGRRPGRSTRSNKRFSGGGAVAKIYGDVNYCTRVLISYYVVVSHSTPYWRRTDRLHRTRQPRQCSTGAGLGRAEVCMQFSGSSSTWDSSGE